ncbi:MAG: ROK family protein [Ginsengibacter sp.]
MQQIIAGVDIGGTHVTVCLVDINKGELLKYSLVRTQVDPSLAKKDIIHIWANAIRESYRKIRMPVGKIGIAMPGPFDYEKGISYIRGLHKFDHLYGENVKDLLADELGVRAVNILMINDASAFLLGELKCGAGLGFHNLVGITLGTGLGSASFFDGKIHETDLWNIPYKEGQAEDYISARWLIDTYENYTNEKIPGVKLIADCVTSDKNAGKVFEEFGKNLGKVLIQNYAHSSPELVIIGGNIAKAWDCFIPSVKHVLAENGIAFLLKPAALGESAALIGGSFLWR